MKEALFSPLKYLVQVFALDEFEEYCVEVLCDAQEGETPEGLAAGYDQPVDLDPYFWPESRLMRYFLVRRGNGRLELDERMQVFLQGNLDGYAPYDFLWERLDLPRAPENAEDILVGEGPLPEMKRFIREAQPGKPVYFHLWGNPGIGKKSRICQLCRSLGQSLLVVDGRVISEENQELLGVALRECRIYGACLLIRDLPANWFGESLYREKLFQWIGEETGIFFTVGEQPLKPGAYLKAVSHLEIHLPMPGFSESCRIWAAYFARHGAESLDPEEWANKFVFTPGQIREAVEQAVGYARRSGRSIPSREDLKNGCYHMLRGGMGKKAVRIQACYTWDELVLPALQKQKLRDACSQAACRKKVYEKWGFDRKIAYGKGISVVFAGPPGTGKTMAAQVMASELCLDLYRIELAAVVSKFIGETEKNLEEIFEQAKKSQVILFFDEADVLFSKRTEVRDANDKYSNMEAAFLLQKMEEYEGITVLATNFLQNFDEAFKRRMKFIIDFPFPDVSQRYQIWQQVFPRETPMDGELDYEFLASAFELSGSNIKNAALHGAFLAAAQGSAVSMSHVIAGVRNEYGKIGKALTKEHLGQYHML